MVNKIFQIGLNKCGTSSIYNLFNKHCFCSRKLKCIHWDDGYLAKTIRYNIVYKRSPILGKYGDYDVITDMEHVESNEIIFAYEDFIKLDISYPNSKFILNLRPVQNWIKSRTKHEKHMKINYVEKYKKLFKLNSDSDVFMMWNEHYNEHIFNVKEYFKERPEDLLVFDIEKDDFSKFIKFFKYDFIFNVNSLPHINKSN